MNEISNPLGQSIEDVTRQTGKYLTFTLDRESYGIGILKVREIIGMIPVTPVPRTPGFIKGVINLRGKVIPVADLRLRFSMAPVPYTERTCIIVLEMEGAESVYHMGIVVDAVSEVLNIRSEDIVPPPAFGTQLDTEYILGMAKTGGGVKILLDIDTVFSELDRASVKATA